MFLQDAQKMLNAGCVQSVGALNLLGKIQFLRYVLLICITSHQNNYFNFINIVNTIHTYNIGCIYFQGSKLSLRDQYMIIYAFSLDFPIHECEKLLPSIAHTTIVNYYAKLRKVISDIIQTTVMEGNVEGLSQIVEIDESLFGKKQKYNKGRPTKKQWVFGLVEHNTRKTFFIPVDDRKRVTLLPIIKEHVKEGTHIYHDDYSVYHDLHESSYSHEIVVHKNEFVSPSGVCTNTIEGT